MSRPVICDLPSSYFGGVNPLTRWVTTLKCEEPHCLADLNGWVAIAWQAAETRRGDGRAPDVTPAVDHHVRLAT
jgi:hypothetical protein